MKFIIDESSGKAIAQFLISQGYDVIYVGDFMEQALDEEVLKYATAENRILVTNDKDFGELVYKKYKKVAGLILIRSKDESPSRRIQLIKYLLDQHLHQIEGSFIVVTEKVVRIRRLS